MAPKGKRKHDPYPWFMHWSRIQVIKRGSGYVYRVTFTPTGVTGEGIDRDEAVAALAAKLTVKASESRPELS